MSQLSISEAGTVQFPMVKHAVEIGWTPIGPVEARQKRGGESGMLFRDELTAKLAEFNPWLKPDAVRSIIETIDAIPATIEGNRDVLAWLRGEKSWYDEEEKRHRHVTLIHFEKPCDNTFHVTWEWTLKPPARKGNAAAVLQPLKDRAERILRDLEGRRTTGMAAMDLLGALAAERDAAMAAARDSGLSPKGFAVFWALRGETSLVPLGIDSIDIAREAEELATRFPNAALNTDEQRRLRANLYKPLLSLPSDERTRLVEMIVAKLLN